MSFHGCIWRWTLYVFALASPSLALNPRSALTQYTETVWTQAQGLPQDTVRAIAQTQDGYIWIGTNEGLARFDGYEFFTFTTENGTLRNNYITALCPSRDGTLWIGTQSGLIHYAGGQFKAFTEAGAPQRTVESLVEDHEGALWIASGTSLTFFKNGRFVTYLQEALAPLQLTQSIYEDSRHQLWVSGVGGLLKRKGNIFVPVLGRKDLTGERITEMRESSEGLWLASNRGLLLLEEGKPVRRFGTRDGLPSELVRAVLQDRAGNLWAGTDSGLARLENHRFVSGRGAKDDEGNLVWCVLEDREGDLWVGTNSALYRLRDDRFIVYGKPEGLPSDAPIAVHQDRKGRIWIGYKNNGIVQFGPAKSVAYSMGDGLPSNEIFSIRENCGGDLLIGTRAGLSRMHESHFYTSTPPFPPGRRAVYDTLEDSRHRLWVGTMNGVFELTGNAWRRVTPSKPGNRGYVVALAETRDGSVYAGGLDGLWRMRDGRTGREELREYASSGGPPAYPVRALLPDPSGALFIGTWGGGLWEIEDGKMYGYSARDGLLSDNVGHIDDDGAGYLWLSTTRGICRISKKQLGDYRSGRIKRLTPENFGIEDGLRSAQCAPGINSGAGGMKSSDGRLWFPTGRGLACYDPHKTYPGDRFRAPIAKIVNVIVDGHSISLADGATLPPGTGAVQFQYAGIYPRNPELVRYSYKLEGLDRDWVSADKRRTTSYDPLPPRKYRFLVRASLPRGLTGTSEFAFTVLPWFYQTSWFLASSAAFVILAAFGAYRLRIAQIRSRFDLILQERLRLAREIHDTLAQAFVGISAQLEGLASKFQSDPGTARRHLALAQKMVRHSVTEARRAVTDLRTVELCKVDLTTALQSSARRWTAGTSVCMELRISTLNSELPGDCEQNLLRIAQEAVANALKHSKARLIRLELEEKEELVKLCVSDDGEGFDASRIFALSDGHFGIIGMRERAENSGGKFHLVTSPGSGTTIEVTIPLA